MSSQKSGHNFNEHILELLVVLNHRPQGKLQIDGGNCTVKRAVRKDTRQVFAAKMCQTNFVSAKNQIDMLVRLDHPNIVNIYEVFQEEGCIILILEFMEGGQLYQAVGQRISFCQSQVKNYMKILLDAVRYCHQMNVVHRDIKPENLLLTKNTTQGLLKLADFGISKILSDEMLSTNCGTPIYMAPQIWRGETYNQKVDIWSIGVVMYYLLSGTHPFIGDEDTLGDRIMFGQLKFHSQIWNLVSSKAMDLVRTMLQKDPEKRPSAVQLIKHLWFSQIQIEIISQSETAELSLTRTVHKIRRFNYKNKQKRARNKLKHLAVARQTLSEARLEFLARQSTDQSNPTQFQGEIQRNMQIE